MSSSCMKRHYVTFIFIPSPSIIDAHMVKCTRIMTPYTSSSTSIKNVKSSTHDTSRAIHLILPTVIINITSSTYIIITQHSTSYFPRSPHHHQHTSSTHNTARTILFILPPPLAGVSRVCICIRMDTPSRSITTTTTTTIISSSIIMIISC